LIIPSRIGVRDDGQAGHAVLFFKPNGATFSAIQLYQMDTIALDSGFHRVTTFYEFITLGGKTGGLRKW
jgi:hypothetical protein